MRLLFRRAKPEGLGRVPVRLRQLARLNWQRPQFLLTMGDVLCEELEDLVHFSVHDLPARGYVVMEEIRRQGKLCDVTLKVIRPRAGASMANGTVPG